MAKQIKQVQEEETPVITKDRKPERVPQEVLPTPPQKQFELSDADVEFLGASQYSTSAWEVIGRKHGVDAATRQVLENTRNRAFIADSKKYAPLEPETGGILTTKNMESDGEYKQQVAIHADSSAIRTEMNRRNLTKPITPDIMGKEDI